MPQAVSLFHQARECARLIQDAESIVAMTGAGISTNAGIPDFRGPQGLYVTKRYDADRIFDLNYFLMNPRPFYEFARDFVRLEERIRPTPAHYFLRRLEARGKLKGVITQNIDALHQQAGSGKVWEIHGSIWKSHCLNCPEEFSYGVMKKRILAENVPHCACGGIIKPDIVFFGENVRYLNEVSQLADAADLFFVIGSSCVVYPAAMIPQMTTGKIVIVNQGEVSLNAPNVVLSAKADVDEFFREVENVLEE